MQLSKSLKIMVTVTAFALIYTHMQMQIFGLAYEGKSNEKKIVNLRENNNMVAYDILRIKSSNNIGVELLGEDSELQFRDQDSIVQLLTSEPPEKQEDLSAPLQKKKNPLLSLLSLGTSTAEARPDEKSSPKPWQRGGF